MNNYEVAISFMGYNDKEIMVQHDCQSYLQAIENALDQIAPVWKGQIISIECNKVENESDIVEQMLKDIGTVSGNAASVRKSVCQRLYRAGYRKMSQ